MKYLQLALIFACFLANHCGQATIDAETLERNVVAITRLLALHGDKDAKVLHDLHAKLAGTLHMLDSLLPDGGSRVEAAIASYKIALQIAEQQQDVVSAVQHRANLGTLLLKAGQPGQAIDWMDTVMKQVYSPSAPAELYEFRKVLFNKAKALAALGRLEEAEQAYEAAARYGYGTDLSTFGKAAAAMENISDDLLAKVLVTLERLGIPILTPATESPPSAANLNRITSNTCPAPTLFPEQFLQQGRLEGFTRVPEDARVWGLWVRVRAEADRVENKKGARAGEHEKLNKTARNEQQRKTKRVLKPEQEFGNGSGGLSGWLAGVKAEDIAWPCFAAYKALDRRGWYSPAWHALEQGNGHMASTAPYDPVTDMQALQIITKVFTGPFPQLGPGHLNPSPIFIIGAPRSGSTLLESMLAARTDVIGAGEDTLLAPLTQDIKAALMAHGPDTPRQLERLGKRYVEGMCRQFVPPDRDCGGVRVVDKNLRNMWTVAYINLILPRACIIHVARHPMDTGLSCHVQPFLSPSLSWSWSLPHTASYLRMVWALAEHWDRTLPGRVHTVFYEELVQYPEATLKRVTDVCGMEWQEGVTEGFHATQRVVATASVAQVRRPLYRNSVGRWQRYNQELAPLREGLGELVPQYEKRLAAALARHAG